MYYIILTLRSQLQNCAPPRHAAWLSISYWLCGVNFKTLSASSLVQYSLYHIDSAESTSKLWPADHQPRRRYIILTLRSQLQNPCKIPSSAKAYISYWLCGVNFKTSALIWYCNLSLYHIDSAESTSKPVDWHGGWLFGISYWLCGVNFKTCSSLFSMVFYLYHIDSAESTSKRCGTIHRKKLNISYWLCGVNFKTVISLIFPASAMPQK